MRRLFAAIAVLALFTLSPGWTSAQRTSAQNPGQVDLDMATELQLGAETLGDLEKVIKFAESALTKGLDQGNQDFAKKLLASTLYQHANRTVESMAERRQRGPRVQVLKEQALKDLEKAKTYDATLTDIYMLEARLLALQPGGDLKAAAASASEAITLLTARDDPKQLSKAYVLRAQIVEDEAQKLADFQAAVKADPSNTEAGQAVALLYIQKGDNESAVAALRKLLERDADNPRILAVLAEALIETKQFDEALKYCDELIKQVPKETMGFNLRARVKVLKEDVDGAIQDLNEALSLNDKDQDALFLRSRLYLTQDKDDLAKADVDKLLRENADQPQAIMMRSLIAANQKRWGDAITDLQVLLQSDPTRAEWKLQLATYYVGDARPRKAIQLLTQILEGIGDENDADQKAIRVDALRARGDALLSVGKHGDAVKDYEDAHKLEPEDTGILNNFAWVLATSPDDPVRNAEKSIQLGLKACELTKYEKPHILSTLAAGYAEKGDFETAKKWSAKAVELGAKDDEIDSQLKKELQSYEQKKPWREKQEVEENMKPIGNSKGDLET